MASESVVVWYKSAQAVIAAYMQSLAAAWGDSLEGAKWGGVDADGNDVEVDPADMLHGIETQGMWGFCDGERIHAWMAPHVDEVKAVGFMAHELAHLHGADAPPIAAGEEAWAELVRGIAEEALTLVRTHRTATARAVVNAAVAYVEAFADPADPWGYTTDSAHDALLAAVRAYVSPPETPDAESPHA